MIHPVFRLAAAQPQLLAEHAGAYAGLFSEALAVSSARLQRRVVLQVAGAACLVVAAMLTGVAVLLWGVMPEAVARSPWLFVLTPLVPAVLGALAVWAGQNRDSGALFATLRLQLDQDLALLRRTSTP